MRTSSLIWLIANIAAFVLSIIWFYYDNSIESIIVGVLALASFVVQFFRKDDPSSGMSIKSGKNSQNYQSSGDININQK